MPPLPSSARVVIIGGGVGGCSIAYHLTQLGWSDVVVVERAELTSGSTFHSAGLVGQLRTSANLTRMIRYSTDQGTIETEVLVNAAGQWAGEIGQMVGLNLPIIPMAHLYLITRPIAGVGRDIPTMRDPDLLVYYREEVGGLIAGGYERQPAPWSLDGIPADFNHK